MYFKTFIILIAVIFAVAPISFAQTSGLKMRTGAHDEYSRLVFEWPQKTFYELSKEAPDTLKITFKNTSVADALNIDAVRNIAGVKKISDAPLTLVVSIASGARYRDFTAGSKIILDVYNTAESAKQTMAKKNANTPPKKEEKSITKNVKTPDTHGGDIPDDIREQLNALENESVKVIVEEKQPMAKPVKVEEKMAVNVEPVEEEPMR